ncbi:penicillin-binding protein activator LpoB [Leptospira ilyithenensis]|uniref:Penicillin-binding protein activator LpoB n=1 Tax=Leptospira ilyithenensis TaxID=2484901 RepID=A0A4R9LIX9_9LEPT|nr:penicillin-binding protein activator LpoB [Leptospira ilyithenensis]TGN06562.1 penicillin-binding protein activator LpoB [Leptospira ilyithenensis]
MNKAFISCFSIVFILSCSSGAKRLDNNADYVADSGGLTSQELVRAAEKLADEIGVFFKENPQEAGVFVAHFPTRNDTSEQIQTELFDNAFVSKLIKNKVYTVRTKTREQSLNEIQFSLSGLTSNRLSIGKLKSPNYFVRADINENLFTADGEKIVEQSINIELVEVETTIAVWSEKVSYRKQAVRGNKGVGW